MNVQDARVLVVDDEPQVGLLICDALRSREVDATAVTSAQEACDLLQSSSFDVVVTDVVMPDMSGLDLLSFIHQRHAHVQVILITAVASIEDAKQAIRQGAFDYVPKPFDTTYLCDLVQEAIEAGREGDTIEEFASPESVVFAKTTRDSLTGFMTPRILHERLSEIRLNSVSSRSNTALLLIDIDNFDEINRTCGYAFGDEVLRQFASRIRGRWGRRASMCRLSGDEFALVVPNAVEHEAANLAEQIRELSARQKLEWKGHPLTVTVSVGVAESEPGFSATEEELMHRARRALAAAKRDGGNGTFCDEQFLGEEQGSVGLVLSEMSKAAEQTTKINRHLRMVSLESVRALTSAVEAKDPYTFRHSEHVAFYAEQIARYCGVSGTMVETIRVAAQVHDIGKIGIPDTVLTKPGRLNDREFALIRQHPSVGASILEKISLLSTESHLVRHHHERWDGKGYPAGLAGEEIPLGSRIINIADSMDAMLMERTYKCGYSVEKMLDELHRCADTQFDMALAAKAIEWIEANRDKLILPSSQPALARSGDQEPVA